MLLIREGNRRVRSEVDTIFTQITDEQFITALKKKQNKKNCVAVAEK